MIRDWCVRDMMERNGSASIPVRMANAHDITPRRRPTISPNDHPSFKLNSHDGCLYVSSVLYSAQSITALFISRGPVATIWGISKAGRSKLTDIGGVSDLHPSWPLPSSMPWYRRCWCLPYCWNVSCSLFSDLVWLICMPAQWCLGIESVRWRNRVE